MRAVKMKKESLPDFFDAIEPLGTLWGPVKNGDAYALEKITDYSAIEMDALRTKISFKKLLTPPKFPMFEINKDGLGAEADNLPKQVIFGLHPCDIHGLDIMDDFYNQNFPDPFYNERRKRTAIIGLSCLPDELCFCRTTNTHYAEKGFDLFLTDMKEFFLIWVGSSLGDDMVRLCPELIDEAIQPDDLKNYVHWRRLRESKFNQEIDFTGMPSIMELSWDSPIWEELGDKCLSCGACTIVCPTCPCFNVYDEMNLKRTEGERVRKWDSCMFREYSMVAGGHNFREARADRLKLRFTHKLQAFVGKFGEPACVGCGRCVSTCPVDIDIISVGKRLTSEEVLA